jgi:hypothetical protein
MTTRSTIATMSPRWWRRAGQDAAEAHLVLVRLDGHAAWSGPIGDLPDLVRFMDRLYRRA